MSEWKDAVCKITYCGSCASEWLSSKNGDIGYIVTTGHLFVDTTERFIKNKEIIADIDFVSMQTKATKLLCAWYDTTSRIDVAVLECSQVPANTEPLRISRKIDTDLAVSTYGFADSNENRFREPADGKVRGPVDTLPDCHLISIRCQVAAQRGFSGAPFYSKKERAVVAVQSLIYQGIIAEQDTVLAIDFDYILKKCVRDDPRIKKFFTVRSPRVYISYNSRTRILRYKEKVDRFFKRLWNDGIDVVIDINCKYFKHYLNRFDFARLWLSNPDSYVDKILVLCDGEYARKADKEDREDLVGYETILIRNRLLQNPQTKIIPVVMEWDENEKSILPSYLSHYMPVDCSNGDEKPYRELVREIYDIEDSEENPGLPPQWLERPINIDIQSSDQKQISNELITDTVQNRIKDYFHMSDAEYEKVLKSRRSAEELQSIKEKENCDQSDFQSEKELEKFGKPGELNNDANDRIHSAEELKNTKDKESHNQFDPQLQKELEKLGEGSKSYDDLKNYMILIELLKGRYTY